MTVGTFSLSLLETEPIRPQIGPLSAQDKLPAEALVKDTGTPIDPGTWRNIVLHGAGEGEAVAGKCHFIVDGGGIHATQNWKDQITTSHVVPYLRGHDYNADSIGVFVKADFPLRKPSEADAGKFAGLIELVAALQQTCGIDRGRVYFHSDLYPYAPGPGEEFAEWMAAQLPRD